MNNNNNNNNSSKEVVINYIINNRMELNPDSPNYLKSLTKMCLMASGFIAKDHAWWFEQIQEGIDDTEMIKEVFEEKEMDSEDFIEEWEDGHCLHWRYNFNKVVSGMPIHPYRIDVLKQGERYILAVVVYKRWTNIANSHKLSEKSHQNEVEEYGYEVPAEVPNDLIETIDTIADMFGIKAVKYRVMSLE